MTENKGLRLLGGTAAALCFVWTLSVAESCGKSFGSSLSDMAKETPAEIATGAAASADPLDP